MVKNPIFELAEIFPINVNGKFKLRMIEILKSLIIKGTFKKIDN